MSLWHRHEAQSAAQERSLFTEIDSRLADTRHSHLDFIDRAKASGVSTEILTTVMAEAMTKRQLAAIFEVGGKATKNIRTLLQVDILPRGFLPPEALILVPDADSTNDIAPVQFYGPILNNDGLPNVIPTHIGRYHITYTQLISDGPVTESNAWIIDRLNAHIPDRFTLAGGDLLQLLEKH